MAKIVSGKLTLHNWAGNVGWILLFSDILLMRGGHKNGFA